MKEAGTVLKALTIRAWGSFLANSSPAVVDPGKERTIQPFGFHSSGFVTSTTVLPSSGPAASSASSTFQKFGENKITSPKIAASATLPQPAPWPASSTNAFNRFGWRELKKT